MRKLFSILVVLIATSTLFSQSPISVTDGTLSDWEDLPQEYVSACVCPEGASHDGLLSMKAYADDVYLNLLVEYNPEVITDLAWVLFHVFIDTDNSDWTGGYGDQWTTAAFDVLLETAVIASEEPYPYNPAVLWWWGKVGAYGWYWTDPSIESSYENCWGAIVCENSNPAVGNSQLVGNTIEIQLDRELIPTRPEASWGNVINIGVDIQQNWSSVGILPTASDDNGNTVPATPLQVKINNDALVEFNYDGLHYITNGANSVMVTGVVDHQNLTTVIIPKTVIYDGKTYTVTAISTTAFKDCSSLTSITIPNSITNIGYAAFHDCSSLASIMVEAGNTIYDSRENCNAIIETATNTLIAGCKNTSIPNSVTSIGSFAFYQCSSLTSIIIPNSVTSIGESAFFGCISVTSVTLPKSVTSIGYAAFRDCFSLSSVTIPNGVTSIGSGAFYGCTFTEDNFTNNSTLDAEENNYWGATIVIGDEINGLIIRNDTVIDCRQSVTMVVIPESITGIKDYAFSGCSALKSVTWNVKNYADYLYNGPFGDSPISSFTFGENVEHIPAYLCYDMDSLKSITIPKSVTSIGNSAFAYCHSLKSVEWNAKNHADFDYYNGPFRGAPISSFTFGESVEYIPSYLCYQIDSLKSITIPNNVDSIGEYAFAGCDSLKSVEWNAKNCADFDSSYDTPFRYSPAISSFIFGENVEYIPAYLCYSMISLNSVTIPSSVTSIGTYTFTGCTFAKDNFINNSTLDAEANNYWGATIVDKDVDGLLIRNDTVIDCRQSVTTATIPGYITCIGDYAFYDCSNLTSITIPESVTSIGNYAFQNCFSLTSITIPDSVTTIGGNIFSCCYSLTSAYIGKGLTYIGYSAFEFCLSVTSITIPENVTSIADRAFHGCSSLTSITIPNSVTSIGANAFSGCSSLTSMIVESGNSIYDSRENCNAIVETATNTLIAGCQNTIIPNSVTGIGSFAFAYCSSLTSITIPNSVTSIGNNAFDGAGIYNDESNWENDVLYIDNCLIEARESISNAYTIKDNTRLIGDDTFSHCSSLTSVTIPNSVTSIGKEAFYKCSSLTSITIPNSVNSIGNFAFAYCRSLKSVEWNVVNHADFIKEYDSPFRGAPISSFTFGENVEYIPAYLCYHMDSLKSVTIPNNVDSIGEYAFAHCSSLTSTTIPNSVISIGEYAFAYCSSLTSITIPNSVISIGDDAFYDCFALKSVEWNVKNHADFGWNEWPFDEKSPIHSFTFGENVEYIPSYLCYHMDSLKSVTIPNNVDSIGEYAFAHCSSLTSTTIPNSVISIGEYAFAYCDSLTSATIGSGVKSIGQYAFYNSDSIKYIFSTPLLPPAIESNVFSSNVYDNATLHVLSSDYKSHDVWKRFDSIQVADTIYSDGIRYKVITKSGELLSESLLTEESFNKFTRVSVEGDYTWRYDNPYGASMNAFQNETNATLPNEDWFISPALDLEGCSSATLTFSHAFGPKAQVPTSSSQKAQYTIWVSNDFEGDVASATWTQLLGMEYGTTAWEYISSGNITIPTENLKANCRVAWKYTCTNASATWEINNVSLSATTHTNTKPTLQVIDGVSPYSGNIVIPSVVKYMNADLEVASIGNIAFRNCSSLNSVTIENGVKTIEEYAFYNSSLAAITLPNTLTSIGYSAFSGCSTLTSISIPNSVKNLGRSAFENCVSLTTIILSNEMTILNDNTFQDCSSLKAVKLGGKLTTIGEYVFSGCLKLNEISLPASITSISENAFATCTKLYDIYCYAMEPPTAYESSFANYNAFLHVPCDNQRVYLLDVLFGNFKYIECLEAETATTDTVVVDPSFNDAEFTWPSNSDADSYTLAISKDGEVFCTLTFNANGQLTGIAFAPSRNRQHNAPAAVQAANGFTFTVTGLDEGSVYTYDLVIKDSEDNTLQSYSGEFRTQSVDDRIIMVEYDATQGEVIGAGTYLLGDIVTLTVIPNEGYQFTTWGDGNTDNPRTLVVTQDTTLTAIFEILTYNVTVTCDPIHGSVTGSGTYNHGDVATLTATPSEGYTFVEWGDGCTDNPRALMVTQDTTLTAVFEILTYNVTVTCDPIHGSVTGSGTYNYGDVVTLTAIPNEGYQFVRWSNEVEDNPYTFVISDNVKLSAEFEAVIHSSVENTHSSSPTSSCQKIFRNGQLLILRDGKTYNVMGQGI